MTGRRQADTTVWERVKAEMGFWAAERWTLKAVGDFWDSETQYDDLNAGIRSYFRRLTDGWRFGIKDWPDKAYALDICSRTGNGTKFFWEKGKTLEEPSHGLPVSECQ